MKTNDTAKEFFMKCIYDVFEDKDVHIIFTKCTDDFSFCLAIEKATNRTLFYYEFDNDGGYLFDLLSEVTDSVAVEFKKMIDLLHYQIDTFESETQYYNTILRTYQN